MAVGVDKAGIEGPAAEIHDVVFARFGVSEDLFTASDAFDAPVRDADGFGFGSLFGHGDDISPDIDGLFAYFDGSCVVWGRSERNAKKIPKKTRCPTVHFELLCFFERKDFQKRPHRNIFVIVKK